jgi:hypothetical protein
MFGVYLRRTELAVTLSWHPLALARGWKPSDKFINKRLRYKSFSPVRTKNGDCFTVRSFTLGPDCTKISPVRSEPKMETVSRSGLLLWDRTALKSVRSGPVPVPRSVPASLLPTTGLCGSAPAARKPYERLVLIYYFLLY